MWQSAGDNLGRSDTKNPVTTRDRTPPSRNEGSQTTLHIYLTEIFGTIFFLNCSANTLVLHSRLTKHSTVHPVYYYIWESTHICVRIHMQIICILAHMWRS